VKETIKEALISSGRILMDHFGKAKTVKEKNNQSNVVTEADLASEKNIVAVIEKKFKGQNIIAEETGFRNKFSEFTWIIDPLDGSSNFAAGIPWFGIIIAVLKDYKPIIAGIYLPYSDEMYIAEKGKGAFRNDARIDVTKERNLRDVLFSYSLDFSEDTAKTDNESKIIREIVKETRNLRSINCVLEYCYVADGRLGGCVNQATKIWDIAAPALMIQEAGGVVSDISGNDLNFCVDKTSYDRTFSFVAASKELHPKVRSIIARAIR
jgi:myo-inositol-1(or 4)-monophosphatase